MGEHGCPLCGSVDGCRRSPEEGYIEYHCETYQCDFLLSDDMVDMGERPLKDELLNLVTEKLLHSKRCVVGGKSLKWRFFYQESYQTTNADAPNYINLAELHKQYPRRFMDKALRVLSNLSEFYPNYHDIIYIDEELVRMVFENKKDFMLNSGILQLLADLGYLDKCKIANYRISAEGWKKIDEMRKSESEIRQGFIAMSFCDKTQGIRNNFRKAIAEAGYQPCLIDEKEHNNQIVPEILFEIGRSKFLVVDITYPNYGAYYEAGYGQALGKEVIICCRKTEFDKPEAPPHFDIAQKSMILWETEEELVERLKRRIEATVR